MKQAPTATDPDTAGNASLVAQALDLYRAGQLQPAKKTCKDILEQQTRPDIILLLAHIEFELKNFHEAILLYRKFVQLLPDNIIGLRQLGGTALRLRHWEESIAAFRKCIGLDPNDLSSTIGLGDALIGNGSYLEAIKFDSEAVERFPSNAKLWRRLGASQQQVGRLTLSIASLEEALQLKPEDVEASIYLARSLRQHGKADCAKMILDRALLLNPGNQSIGINLAHTLRQLNEKEAAIDQLKSILKADPTSGEAHYQLSSIHPTKDQIPLLEKLAANKDTSKKTLSYYHFSMGRIFEKEQLFSRAFRHFNNANKLRRATFNYSSTENTDNTERIIKTFSEKYFQEKKEFGSNSQLPIFIVGMPRSGTTLVEQIISSHQQVFGAGELQTIPAINQSLARALRGDLAQPECMTLLEKKLIEDHADQYLQELKLLAPDFAHITDKQPGNFARVGVIKTLFPKARIVACERNAMDNCLSLFFHCFEALKCSFNLAELGQYYVDHNKLMNHWYKLFGDQILRVKYEQLIMDQERVTRDIIEYLGLGWENDCLDFYANARNVMSPSNLQVRKPLYRTSMNRLEKYKENLTPLFGLINESTKINPNPNHAQ